MLASVMLVAPGEAQLPSTIATEWSVLASNPMRFPASVELEPETFRIDTVPEGPNEPVADTVIVRGVGLGLVMLSLHAESRKATRMRERPEDAFMAQLLQRGYRRSHDPESALACGRALMYGAMH
jgi:hypothetical protein